VIDQTELRRRLRPILDAEERGDWEQVDELSDELNRTLIGQNFENSAEIVNHYLDDGDIRQTDPKYAISQRDELRRFIETGEDRTIYLPRWSCAGVAILLIGALAYWLVF
jgi:hypothetical protein